MEGEWLDSRGECGLPRRSLVGGTSTLHETEGAKWDFQTKGSGNGNKLCEFQETTFLVLGTNHAVFQVWRSAWKIEIKRDYYHCSLKWMHFAVSWGFLGTRRQMTEILHQACWSHGATQVLNSMWDNNTHTHTHTQAHIEPRWVIMQWARPCNVILMVISLAVICYGTCHFGREPGLIGLSLRGGGLDPWQAGSNSQLLQRRSVFVERWSVCVLRCFGLYTQHWLRVICFPDTQKKSSVTPLFFFISTVKWICDKKKNNLKKCISQA